MTGLRKAIPALVLVACLAACGRDDPLQPPDLSPEAEKLVGAWLTGEEPHQGDAFWGGGAAEIQWQKNIFGQLVSYRFDADGTMSDAFCLHSKDLGQYDDPDIPDCARQWSLEDTIFVLKQSLGRGPFPPDALGFGSPWSYYAPPELDPFVWEIDDNDFVSLTATLSLKFVTEDSVVVYFPGDLIPDRYSTMTRMHSMPRVLY